MPTNASDLWAEATIMEVQKRYCRGVDRRDFAMVRDCFHADAELDYGDYKGDVDGFVRMAEAGLAIYGATTHFIGNQLVELDGDTAWAEHYVVAYHRCPAAGAVPDHDFVCNFRYVDRMEWRPCRSGSGDAEEGEWRIAARVLLVDSWRRVPLPDLGPGPTMKPGRRDRDDLSWSDTFRRRKA
ncbi:nuclear transport factor 2 family protein [Novosphingobium sp. G106]|uniref:nuclear transport factor 2 family protein n=1 Tax=Novosphingobium sp. G106 TaxID=2849500 RepID=UPI001C2D16CA|nr:nuclear transport factor 2 family protein [Novosphingobium sp. G106]MBV1690733.1 nuclear transport factor 2 family protein [Novosphingobium sp. G106]